MKNIRRKEKEDQRFEEEIVSGTNVTQVKTKVQENAEKKDIKKLKQIPSYSSKKLKQIQQQIKKLNPQDKSEINESIQSIICLMCWIWQAESIEYKSQKNIKKTKSKELQEDIESYKCMKALFQFFNKNHSLFFELISIDRDIISKNPIKSINVKNSQANSNPSKITNQNSNQNYSFQDISTTKNYFIYEIYTNTDQLKKKDHQISLITFLLEIIVFSYDSLNILDFSAANSIISNFALMNTKNKGQNESKLKQKILQQLLIFAFSEIHFMKIAQASNSQGLHCINRKVASQEILWRFFANVLKVIQVNLSQNQFLDLNVKNLETLKTAHILVSEFTYYMKKKYSQLKQVKISEIQSFFQIYIRRITSAECFLLELRQRKNNSQNDLLEESILNYQFSLLLFDWAVLVIKSNDQKNLFKKVMKICKKLFFKAIDEKNIDFKENQNNFLSQNRYNDFVIEEDPNEFSEGQSRIEDNYEEKSQKTGNLDHQKIKTFLTVPFMTLLTLKEHLPLSVQRKHQKKMQNKKESQDDCLIFLLILYNRQYIMQLLQEIQFIQTEELNPQIGKGLVKLCAYCNKFTSLILIERYFKVLSSKPYYKDLLQSVFQKNVDHQRRLSQSKINYHSNKKVFQQAEFQNSNQNDAKMYQTSQAINQEEIKVRLRSCESIFFQMITETETKIPILKLSTYCDEALKKPQIFRAEVFYQKLLEFQKLCFGREYLSQLIIKWIDNELRFFNILIYFDLFFKKCLFSGQDEEQLTIFIQELPISKLIKLHCLLLTETFSEQSISKNVPLQGLSHHERIQVLTSGGFQQKSRFIDKQFNEMAEIILWNKYLNLLTPLQSQQKFVYSKSYFTLIFYSFSPKQNWSKNEQKLIILIEKLKIDIQKDRIDEVCSIFHFLSLALFPNMPFLSNTATDLNKNKNNSQSFSNKGLSHHNGNQKIIQQIFYIIKQNHKKIIDMFKNKQSLTFRCLIDDLRRKTTNNAHSDLQDMKRKQVTKMLNRQKLMHDYLIKTIVRFIQNIQYTQSFLRNFYSPEQFIGIVAQICKRQYLSNEEKMFQKDKILYTPKLNYFFSSVSSKNYFELHFKKQLKRFEENFEKHYDRLSFVINLRFIAQKWIDQISQNIQSTSKIKSKFNKSSKSSALDNRSKHKNNSVLSLISIQSIFKICLSVLEIRIESSMTVRQSEILKQKIICLETICLLSNFIILNTMFLQSVNSSILKPYRTSFHQKVSSLLVKFLMNNETMLGKNQRQLIIQIRLQSLSHIIQNYSFSDKYDRYEWRLMKDRKIFWFLIDCLIFDRAIQLRFFIVKNLLSRFSISPKFRTAMYQKLVIFALMTVEEPSKYVLQLAKQTLAQTLEYFLTKDSSKGLELMLNLFIKSIQIVVNFNLVNILQRDEKKIDEKQLFEMLIDTIFEKSEIENYFFLLVQNFKSLMNCKSRNQLIKVISPLDWEQIINIDFYLTTKYRANKSNSVQNEKEENKKVYLQLLKQINDQNASQSSKNSKNNKKSSKSNTKRLNQLESKFFQMFLQTLKSIEEVFKIRYVRINKKYVKTKKPIYRTFDTPIAPSLSQFLNLNDEKKEKTQSGRNLRQSDEEIQI